MKVFVSGKIGSQGDVRALMDQLEARGHEITFDWTTIDHLRPYEINSDASAIAAQREVEGVRRADVLIVVAHERGVGMYVELGVALGLGKPVVVVAKDRARTMFFFHPLVTTVGKAEEVFGVLESFAASG